MISSAGIGTGIDVNSIISQLMAVERQPLNRLTQQKSDYSAQLSAYGKLKSALSTFRSAMSGLDSSSDFKLYTATSSNEDIFTATASSSASVGVVDVKVNQLAEAHKMGSKQFADSDTTTVGNSGETMTITVNGSSIQVDLGQNLGDLRDAINDNSDNDFVTASIVKESDSSYYLTLTSRDTGTANAISVSYSGADPLTMADIKTAKDSEIVIDGTYTVTRSSNTVTDAVQGITLNLLQADTVNTYTLNIDRDLDGVRTKVQSFVDAYNTLNKTIEDLRTGDLAGDNSLLDLKRNLLNELNTKASGINSSYSYLADVGVSIQKDGTMKLDGDTVKLKDALEADFTGVAELFGNNDQGFAYRLQSLANDMVQIGGNGLIQSREDGLNDRIDSIGTRIDSMNQRLTLVEQRYRDQFTALDGLVGQLQATGNFLSQQLGRLGL